jgi:DNA recombination protein RmuC
LDILFLIIGLALGFVVTWFYIKSTTRPNAISKESEDKIIVLEKEKIVLEERLKNTAEEKERAFAELNVEREKLNAASSRLAKAEEAFKNQDEKLKTQKAELEEIQKKFAVEFENIANKILEDKSKKFTDQNKTNLDIILNPLKEKIKDFETKVDNSYKAEAAERNALKGEIKLLMELNKQISLEANNLASALKGDNKMQGNWGEIILEKVLERSGLVKDQEYKKQVSTLNEEGRKIQPDFVVYLPDNKHIVIDSKVSLVAYEAFVNTKMDEEKEKYMKEHIVSIKTHVKLLSDKNYQASGLFNTPDFVLLFIPIESSFSVAVQADHEIFNYAWEKKIVIVSPSTLLATLRTIASVWKQERQTKNALEIAEQSGRLYDKFVGFLEDLSKIGERIGAAQIGYDEAMKKLSTGTGNLISRAENIKKLGAKNTKSISDKLIISDEENT